MPGTTQPLTYTQFKAEARRLGLTVADFRSGTTATPERSALIDACGLGRVGRYVDRLEREQYQATSLFGDYPARLG